ncbi:MAG TPA: hypothetical protein VG758_31090 [Hyphomicrobiaceae bacterium]|jgi:hypothetical protein|nr:hypothetical protein [Hyphomicrobiaceae bacterium]
MYRAIVLVLCVASAGAIVGYTRYTGGDAVEPVYTVPSRPSISPPNPPAPVVASRPIDPEDRAALARALQRELKRVGCYGGDISGVWTTSSRMAMKSFIERVNASLPVDIPDTVLLNLVQGHRERACGAPCPAGQTAAESGTCLPNGVAAKAVREAPGGKADAISPDAAKTDAARARALALAAPAATPKADPKASPPAAARPAAAPPGAPLPPEGMVRERQPSRAGEEPAPPKVVRDVLKVLGF